MNYGPNVTITKTITILADGIEATIATPVGTSMTINAPAKTVVLRGLRFTGLGTGQRGVDVVAAGAVSIERREAERYVSTGILLSSGGKFSFRDVVSRHNGGEALSVSPTSGTAQVVIDRSQFMSSFNGVASLTRPASSTPSSATRLPPATATPASSGMAESGSPSSAAWPPTTAAAASWSPAAVRR